MLQIHGTVSGRGVDGKEFLEMCNLYTDCQFRVVRGEIIWRNMRNGTSVKYLPSTVPQMAMVGLLQSWQVHADCIMRVL